MGTQAPDEAGVHSERGESFVEVIVALLITVVFVTAVFSTIDTMLLNYRSQLRQTTVEVAIQRARADLEAQPYCPFLDGQPVCTLGGTYTLPSVPGVTFDLQVTSVTQKHQQLTVTATNVSTARQVTLFKTDR